VASRPGRAQRESFAQRRERRAAIDDPEIVLNAAARFLEVRSRSIDEVRRHLTRAGYRPDLVDSAVARLEALGMLDDGAFARLWVESRDRARPRSETALRRELAQKGIDPELSAEVLAERRERAAETGSSGEGDPDALAARLLLARRSASLSRIPDPRERRQRAYALLARAGFDPETCRSASVEVVAGRPDEESDSPA
jgi:regulatory protein